ncbi:hypothetical protein PVAND_014443 [Polypedilum vanderplanki]|uniref:SSD domain-containing protein n=1 Tax=Polypedilum vanderplanki TaxID=319348 RepID=A0A9J6B9W5_POLVA|nr:hypothetical protein PVAND_014443 [Polypedilum vanderplanki]
MVYTGLVLYRFGDPVNGQSGVGMFGILLLCASTAAGLGVCSLLGLAFNVSTTQVVPLIALGLAVDQIFILTHGYDTFKLLAQTGHVDNPIDKSLITHNRLVNSDGIINPKAFYNYLSAWAWNDAAYGASQSNLRPSPRMWIHSPKDKHMKS